MKKKLNSFRRTIDRVISGSIGKQLLFFLIITVIVFALEFAARALIFPSTERTLDGQFWDSVFNFIDVGGFEGLNGAERWLMLFINLSGMVIFAGALVALLTNTIFQRIDDIKNGSVYYDFSDHIVIIGFDPVGGSLVRQLAAQYEIVLMTAKDVQETRQKLLTGLEDCLKKKLTVVSGDRTLADDVRKLNIDKCVQVFLLGDMGEDDRDAENIECLKIINGIIAETGVANVRCHVLFERQLTFAVFQRYEIPRIRGRIDLVPFNFDDMWARKVFVDNTYNGGEIVYTPLDREPITEDSAKRVHLVILGMSDMGAALAVQAAQICHFPNFFTKGIKTKISFIDEDAERKMNGMKNRLRSFFDEIDYSLRVSQDSFKKETFTDIEIEFVEARFDDDEARRYLEEAAADKDSYLTVAVTLSDSAASLETALYLPDSVYDSGASVLVRQDNSYAITSLLSQRNENSQYNKFENLRPFAMIDNSYDLKQADDLLPMMIKYVYDNSNFNEARTIREFPEEAIRENWIKNWKESDNIIALKTSNRCAANFIPAKCRSLGIKEGVPLNQRQIEMAALIEHNRWLTEKLLIGFRAPTPEEAAIADKDKRAYFKARFIHEDIKAYHHLGDDEKNIDVRIYDINISNAVPYMLEAYSKRKV